VRRVWCGAAALVLALAPAAARADERILRYVSDVAVQTDSSLDVTETIDVRAENVRINHGIFRDFPTRYRGRNGAMVRVGFQLEGATLDGQPVPAGTESVANGVRIKIGDPETVVSPQEHRYVLHYRTTRQIGRFADYDELYWNVTGNGWIFPIDQAEARITLPQAAAFGQRAVYTGPQGATGQQARVVEERPGTIRFQTTGPLGAFEGLTVAVAWRKGIIPEPTTASRRKWWLADNGPPMVGVLALFGLLGFFWTAWKRVGRDPRPGTVVPLFSPADDLSPAAMRYIWKMGTDNRAFAATLVDLGVKGHVRLIEEEGGWFSSDKTRIDRLASDRPLSTEEEALLRELAGSGESIVMEQKNHDKFSSAHNALNDALKSQFEEKMFHRNWGWAGAGVLLFVAALWLVAMAVALASGTGSGFVAVSLGATLTAGLLMLLAKGVAGVGNCLVFLLALVLFAIALFTGLPALGAVAATGWFWPFLPPLLALPLVFSAFWWIAAPTKEGRAVLDRIAGFRQYLSIAERERLDRMTAPEDTPEIFERYLPYAIALGVENRWADRFRGVLAAAQAQGQQGFGWYSGSGNPWNDTGSFVVDVGSTLASTISSASTAPGSSSGSGGGGSSGGGGGGGGGGGW